MTFNQTGRLIRSPYALNGEALEQVQSFCYLGFDIKCSGIVKHAMNILCDKASKALRPLLCAIARFNISTKTSINLFHTLIFPTVLYNAENWGTLNDKMRRNFTIFDDIAESKVNVIHRNLLKFILGVNPALIWRYTAELGKPLCLLKNIDLLLTFGTK